MSINQAKQNNLQQWLQSINCLDSFTQNQILNGMLIYKIITNTNPASTHTVKQLSSSTTTLNRVSNWNILSQQLKKINISLTQQHRSNIISGNQQIVIDLVSQLKEFHLKKEKSSEVDITQVDPKKDLNDAKSLLQGMLILMIRNFHLSPKEAVALLSNQSKYLAHILTKGLKGEFKGIENFMQQMSRYLPKIIEFCKSNQENVVFFVRSIKPALISKSQGISLLCLHFFNKFLLNFPMEERINIFETHLLSTYLLTIKRHPYMEDEIVVSMLQTIILNEKTLDKKNNQNKPKQMQTQSAKQLTKEFRIKVMKSVFSALSSQSQNYMMVLAIINIFGQKGRLQQFLHLQFLTANLQKSIQLIKKEQYTNICIDIVLSLGRFVPQIFSTEEQEEIQQKYHLNPRVISQTLIQNLRSVKNNSIAFTLQLFTLLHQFGQSKHFIAPGLYKLIVEKFSQVQDFKSDIYEVYLNNFAQTIKQFSSIPWNGVLDIVLGRKKSSSSEYEQINQNQLEFFYFLLNNDNMQIKRALMIFDIVSKTFMQTYHLCGYLTKLIVKIVDLFATTQPIVQELAAKLIKVCLAIHHANTKKFSQKRKSLTGNSKITQQQALMKIKNNSIQFLILKIAQLHIQQLNSKIEPLVAFSYIQMKEKSEYVKGFKKILETIGNFNQIVQKYQEEIKKAQEDAKQQQRLQKMSKQKQKEREKQKMSQSKVVSKVHSKHRYDDDLNNTAKQSQFIDETPQRNKGQSMSMHTRPFNASYLGITPSAQKGIQKFQKVYLTKIQKQDFEKIRKQQQDERQQLIKKIYRKKMVSHYGIDIKGETDQIQYLFQFNSQENLIYEKSMMRIPFYTNQTEEDRDMMACEKLMKSYQKPLKVLFSIYSGQKKGQALQNFDEIAQKNITISSSSVYKLLKDFGFQDFISLRQVQQLTQKVNIELNTSTADYQFLDVQGFIEFIKQSSFLMFTRPPKDLRGQPLTLMLEETFFNLKLFAVENKVNEQIFQQPGNIFFNQTDAVTELNRKLIKNPDYILPEGYKKIVEKKITFEHGIYLQAMSETYKVVFEVVDQLLHKALGVHIIEPFTKEQKVTKARPALFVAQRLKIDSMATKHIPVNLKKQIMKIPIKSRTQAKECAIVIDQIITAIELGHDQIGQRHFNKVQVERRKQYEQQKKMLQMQKRRRENRNRHAKTAIEQYKDKRQQKQKDQSLKKQDQQKKIKQQKQRKERQGQQLKKKIQQYNKKKKQEEEEKIKRKKQHEEKEKREREKLKQINEETKKKIEQEKRKKEQQENAKKTEKEQQEKRLKQIEKKKMQQSKVIKKKMVQEFKLRKSQVKDTGDKTLNKEIKNLQSFGQGSDMIQ